MEQQTEPEKFRMPKVMLDGTECLKEQSQFREQLTLAVRDSCWLIAECAWELSSDDRSESAGDSVGQAEVSDATGVVQSV